MGEKLTYTITSIQVKGDTAMVELQCQRCKHKWDYKGKNEYYAPCSKCKTSVSLKKATKDQVKHAMNANKGK